MILRTLFVQADDAGGAWRVDRGAIRDRPGRSCRSAAITQVEVVALALAFRRVLEAEHALVRLVGMLTVNRPGGPRINRCRAGRAIVREVVQSIRRSEMRDEGAGSSGSATGGGVPTLA